MISVKSKKVGYYPWENEHNKFVRISQEAIKKNGYELCRVREIWKYKAVILNWFEKKDDSISRYEITYLLRVGYLFICRILGKKIYVVYHNRIPHEDKTSFFQRVLIKSMFCLSNNIIILSKNTTKYATEMLGIDLSKKFYYIPHPNYIGAYLESPIESQNTMIRLLFFGMIKPYKNIEIIIEVAKFFENEDIVFDVVGKPVSDTYAEELEKKANGLKNIHFEFGFVEDAKLSKYLQSCDALILPYDKTTLNSGTVILGFSFAKTAIVPNISTVGDFNNENIYVYDFDLVEDEEKHFEAIVKEIEHMISDIKKDRDILKKKGEALFQEVKNNNNLDVVSELYARLLENAK